MRKSLLILGLALASTASMAKSPKPAADGQHATGPHCLPVQDIIGRRIVDDHTIAFDVPGATYQAEVADECAALARGPSLLSIDLDAHGGEVCSGDMVRIGERGQAGGRGAFMRCRIGSFSRVAKPAR